MVRAERPSRLRMREQSSISLSTERNIIFAMLVAFIVPSSLSSDAAERFKEAGYKYEIQSDTALMVFSKENSIDHTQVSLCDDSRYGYYMIEGRVQNIIEWIKKG